MSASMSGKGGNKGKTEKQLGFATREPGNRDRSPSKLDAFAAKERSDRALLARLRPC